MPARSRTIEPAARQALRSSMRPEQYGQISLIKEMIDFVNDTGLDSIGTVDDAAAQIDRLLEQSNGGFGCYMLLAHEWANPTATKRSYDLISQHVMPRFQGQASSTLQRAVGRGRPDPRWQPNTSKRSPRPRLATRPRSAPPAPAKPASHDLSFADVLRANASTAPPAPHNLTTRVLPTWPWSIRNRMSTASSKA